MASGGREYGGNVEENLVGERRGTSKWPRAGPRGTLERKLALTRGLGQAPSTMGLAPALGQPPVTPEGQVGTATWTSMRSLPDLLDIYWRRRWWRCPQHL